MPDRVLKSAISVVYVDDDVALVRLVQKTLGRGGFQVAHAANGNEALAHIAEGGVHVIALDHYLANGTGLDFLAKLAFVEDAPPVVYVTGSSEIGSHGSGGKELSAHTPRV
jgi:DNA-binding NtrC family response regulator